MINKIIKPTQLVITFIDEMKHISINQWDIDKKH